MAFLSVRRRQQIHEEAGEESAEMSFNPCAVGRRSGERPSANTGSALVANLAAWRWSSASAI